MMIHLDTSVIVDALAGTRESLPPLERTVAADHVLAATTLALYRQAPWLGGTDHRTQQDVHSSHGAARQ